MLCRLRLQYRPPTNGLITKKSALSYAITSWLKACEDGTDGAELDLSKAYDNIGHEVADSAMEASSYPDSTRYVCKAAWQGPRHCSLNGELAPPSYAYRGLPQGDSTAPGVMISTLSPWQPFGSAGAFMDDRYLVAQSSADLDEDLRLTAKFDQEVGFSENLKKRQRWSCDDLLPKEIEHLGILACPTDPSADIVPRQKWEKLTTAIAILNTVPGSHIVRIRLAYVYVRPLWLWASPVTVAPPAPVAKSLATAIWRTGCTWWCMGRWWAQHVSLHPLYSTSLQAFKKVDDEKLVWSAFMEHTFEKHALALGLQFIRYSFP